MAAGTAFSASKTVPRGFPGASPKDRLRGEEIPCLLPDGIAGIPAVTMSTVPVFLKFYPAHPVSGKQRGVGESGRWRRERERLFFRPEKMAEDRFAVACFLNDFFEIPQKRRTVRVIRTEIREMRIRLV